jgi:hypothetical protein
MVNGGKAIIMTVAMTSFKEAAQNAMQFAIEALGKDRTEDLRLEEVDSSQSYWLITLSMIDKSNDALQLARVLGGPKREYKTFTVSKDTGVVTSMKMKEFAAA